MSDVPAPLISAPIFCRKIARSTISGSRAALPMVVTPSASTAASMRFSVAPTLAYSRSMSAPFRRRARSSIQSGPTSMSAPMRARPDRCMSMLRLPRLQPPGCARRARRSRATSGPSSTSDARTRSASSADVSWPMSASTVMVRSPRLPAPTRAPRCSSIAIMLPTSAMSGTLRRRDVPSARSAAARSFSAEFLAPLTVICPPRRGLRRTTNASIRCRAYSRVTVQHRCGPGSSTMTIRCCDALGLGQQQPDLGAAQFGAGVALVLRIVEVLSRAVACRARPRDVNLVRMLGHVRQHRQLVVAVLQKALVHSPRHGLAATLLHAHGRDLQREQNGLVARQNADLPLGRARIDRAGFPTEQPAGRADDVYLHLG